MSANGVCGNLQFMSSGGTLGFLGAGTQLYMVGDAGTLYIYANIPDNYVVQKAILTLKSNAGIWDKWDVGGTVIGCSKAIRFYKASANAGLAMSGAIPGNACASSVGSWEQIVSGGFILGGVSGSTTQATKNIVSNNIASKLTTGMNVFKLTATESKAEPNTALAYVGTGIAILDVIGYSKN